MPSSQQQLVEDILRASRWHLDCLRAVRALGLPDWAIGAGFVRNAVWDHLQGHAAATPLNDIDVLFFDPQRPETSYESKLETTLEACLPARRWSLRNQARMHRRNGDRPYRDTLDALSFWLETPTAVAVRLEDDERFTVLAPFGLEDLLAMVARPTPAGLAKSEQYRMRMAAKNWPACWPNVTVEELTAPATR